jgi:hypothetical protein
MLRITALSIAALILTASAYAETYTEQSNQFCTYHAYVISGTNVEQVYVHRHPSNAAGWSYDNPVVLC